MTLPSAATRGILFGGSGNCERNAFTAHQSGQLDRVTPYLGRSNHQEAAVGKGAEGLHQGHVKAKRTLLKNSLLADIQQVCLQREMVDEVGLREKDALGRTRSAAGKQQDGGSTWPNSTGHGLLTLGNVIDAYLSNMSLYLSAKIADQLLGRRVGQDQGWSAALHHTRVSCGWQAGIQGNIYSSNMHQS